jgi:hypothetical protein
VQRVWILSLLLGCTPTEAAQPAECVAVPTVVALSPDQVRVQTGIASRNFAMPEDPRELVTVWREQEHRPACSGTSDVVLASDDVDAVVVLATATGLQRECERPTRVVLRPGDDPVPLAGVHFCGCPAAEPFELCSSPELDLRRGARTRQVARLRGGKDCNHGARPMVSISRADQVPPTPPALEQRHPDPAAAVEASRQPHADLPPCRDAFVRADASWSWGELRRVLRPLADYRITLDLAE